MSKKNKFKPTVSLPDNPLKKLKKENPAAATEAINAIVKNTYRTLMTRGMKGCYVYAEDENLREWLKESVGGG